MNEVLFSSILLLGSLLAGFVGALTGLGGGIIIVPMLTLGFGVPMKYAVAASLISVIGTSSGAATAYLREGITNMKVGMFLQIATALGAVLGAVLVIGIIFGIVLIITAVLTAQKKPDHQLPIIKGSLAEKLQLTGSYKNKEQEIVYGSQRPILGSLVMAVAGFLSGLLGVGGGVFKVLAMDNIMKLPFKVSTTTSNFMIGVTAVASSIIYFAGGYVNALITAPILIGIIIGAKLGSKVLVKVNVALLKRFFAIVVAIIAIYMMYNGFVGNFSGR
jgi:uncharacterized membrane protein YfcA